MDSKGIQRRSSTLSLQRSQSSTSITSLRRRSASPFTKFPSSAFNDVDLSDKPLLHSVAEDDAQLIDSSGHADGLLRRTSSAFIREELGQPHDSNNAVQDSKPVSWRSLPRKGQLGILLLSRLAEPLASTSIAAYAFFMLKSFDPELSDAAISYQAGVMQASFTATQCVTAVMWGRAADRPWMGRKRVIIIGLIGTCISVTGFGFSRSLYWAIFFRSLGGALNGNIGVMRTMISEIILEKKYQPKAFLILPITFNVGSLIGPIIGGWLQDPVRSYPIIFGPGSRLGGATGIAWMLKYPYALPNLVNAAFLFFSVLLVILGLEETLFDLKGLPDRGLILGHWLKRCISSPWANHPTQAYSEVASSDPLDGSSNAIELETHAPPTPTTNPPATPRRRPKLPFRRIFTPNVIFTLLSHGLMALHVATFNNLWFIFLSTPRSPASASSTPPPPRILPAFLTFTGGLGLTPSTIGIAIGILGFIGLLLQFGLYSRVTHRLGVMPTFRLGLALFPAAYTLAPFLARLPPPSPPPSPSGAAPPTSTTTGGGGASPATWAGITALLALQVLARTFALALAQVLVNNCSPHPSVLGQVHGLAQSVSSGMRTVGPVAWSALYGVGLEAGVVGLSWWALAMVAVVGLGVSALVREGDGHEVWLEGDEGEE